MDFLESTKEIKMKTYSLLKSLLPALLLPLFFTSLQSQTPSEKLTRDDWTELYGHITDLGDPRQDRVAENPAPSSLGGEMGLRTNACAAAFIMNTPYNSNNGQRGCMFDITATNAVTIRCFESNVYAGTTANYEIYYRAGTHVGSENNAAAWTFIGGATGITSAGNNVPTALPIPVNVTIPAGATYSFYITNDFGGGTSYTDGTAVGNFLAADANITVFEGVGKSYPFGLTFAVRNFNGHIFYDLGGVLDADEITLESKLTMDGPSLNWRVGEQMAFTSLQLERSTDGLRFDQLADLPAEREGDYLDRSAEHSPVYFYRLRMEQPDGQIEYSNALEVRMEKLGSFDLTGLYPNPFHEQVQVQVENHLGADISMQVLDRLGRVVYENEYAGEKGSQQLQPTLSHLPSGMYLIRIRSGQTVKTMPLIRH